MTRSSAGSDAEENEASNSLRSERLIEGISSHAIFEVDAEGTIESWSGSAKALYGFGSDSVTGKGIDYLFAEDQGPKPDLETIFTQPTDRPQEIEHWNKRADGSVFWATLTFSSLDTDGMTGFAVISQDTTGKKQYEQMLERQNDRLKEFTDIIAHDLRNPLNVIDGRLDLYRETREDEHIEYIEETTERMERLVNDLLRVARQGDVVTDPGPTDLESVINTAWEGTGNTRPEATLVYEEVPSVGADYDRLCELFENLFRNAIEHGGPAVTVQVGPLKHGFFVEDDGKGIPEENRDEVFDHGFTTIDTGSGYGLSVVRTIINAHGWNVTATESENGGARFEITGVEFLD